MAYVHIEARDPKLAVILTSAVAGVLMGYAAGGITGAPLGGFAGLVGDCLATAIIYTAISEIQGQASHVYQYQYS